jgi:hypothetical protein
VLYGQSNHHVLPLDDWAPGSEPIEASSADYGALQKVIADIPLSRAEIIVDGATRRMMRDVALEIISVGPPSRFRIVHSDPSLNQLMRSIAARGRAT